MSKLLVTFRGTSILAAILICSIPVVAQEASVHFISPTEATSDCIGDPRTPECAMEMFLACFYRKQMRLCEVAGVMDISLVLEQHRIEYKYKSEWILLEENIPINLHEPIILKPRYVEFEINEKILESNQPHKVIIDWSLYFYALERVGERWRVRDWRDTESEDFHDTPIDTGR